MVFFGVELFNGQFNKKIKHTRSVNISIRGFINNTDIRWNDIFSFVPLGIKSCMELFPGENKTYPFGLDFVHKSIYYRRKLRDEYVIHEDRDSNVWRYPEEAKVLHLLGLQPHVRTICETGFNAGHSAYVWLITNPNVTVISFDLGNNNYSRHLAKILQRQFQNRLIITWGDSVITLPAFRREHPGVTCDVIFMDGGRAYDVVNSDLLNFLSMTDGKSVIIFNNYPPKNRDTRIGRVWEMSKRSGEVTEIFHCDYLSDKKHGFSVGRVEPKLNSLISS
jgi:hypothetical protein